jgi:flagellar motor switch protein FliM
VESRQSVTPETPRAGAVIPFDFRSPRQLPESHLRILRSLHGKFAEAFSILLRSKLQTPVPVVVAAVEQVYYGDYLPTTEHLQTMYIVKPTEIHGTCLLEFEARTVIAIVARLLGAVDEGEIRPRRITKLELSVLKGIVQNAVETLGTAWKGVSPLGLVLDRLATDADMARLMPTNEILVTAAISLTIAGQEYPMRVCYPATTLSSVLSPEDGTSQDGNDGESAGQSSAILDQLQQTRVEAVAVLGTTAITTRELLDLEGGDILRIDDPTTGEIQIVIDGAPRFWGRAGIVNGRMAVKLTRIAGEEEGVL